LLQLWTTELPLLHLWTTELPLLQLWTTELPLLRLWTTELPSLQLWTTELPLLQLWTTELPLLHLWTTELPLLQLWTTELPLLHLWTTELPLLQLWTARQDIPGPPSGRTLRGAGSEVEQMHNYISRIGTNLHEAIGNRDADLIRSYRRALNSGILRAHEAANRETDARVWDPVAVDGMLQEVEESTATLLPAAEHAG
jgi:hypothetical protein